MDSITETKKKINDKKYNNSPAYNQEYYAKKRLEILATLKAKCICELCGRKVSYQRMKLHRDTELCLNNRTNILKDLTEQNQKLKQEINILKNIN